MSNSVKVIRCEWAEGSALYQQYHDTEWGVPSHDDKHLFEMLILEGAQAGLSWSTILNKRRSYRKAHLGFDPKKVAKFSEKKQQSLLLNPGIVRNRAKVGASVLNAQKFLEIQKEFGSFDKYLWGFVKGKPIQNRWKSLSEVPAETDLSKGISKDLKKRGFKFVGPTIIYAYLQAVGVVNDHVVDCPRWKECNRIK